MRASFEGFVRSQEICNQNCESPILLIQENTVGVLRTLIECSQKIFDFQRSFFEIVYGNNSVDENTCCQHVTAFLSTVTSECLWNILQCFVMSYPDKL